MTITYLSFICIKLNRSLRAARATTTKGETGPIGASGGMKKARFRCGYRSAAVLWSACLLALYLLLVRVPQL